MFSLEVRKGYKYSCNLIIYFSDVIVSKYFTGDGRSNKKAQRDCDEKYKKT